MAQGEPNNCLSCITVNNLFSHNKQLDTDCKELRRIGLIMLEHLKTVDTVLEQFENDPEIKEKYESILDVEAFLENK